MKIKHIITATLVSCCTIVQMTSCTDLSETVYSSVMTTNYYNTKQDVINAVFRPFEHVYSGVVYIFEHEELTGDHLITPTRGSWWYDGGQWEKFHRHQYDELIGQWTTEWNYFYQGIGQCNLVLDDLSRLNPTDFDMTQEEFDSFRAQLRCMRAFCYLRLLNAYRNCVLTTTSDQGINELPENRKQVPPKTLFDFIESELKDFCLSALPTKTGSSGNGNMQGSFTKGAAAGFLVRLYLNAEVWIGEDRYQECINMCERIRNGEFGTYTLAKNWWEPFDWNNETCDEVIFGFPGSYSGVSWHMQNTYRTCYGRGLPYGSAHYLEVEGDGERNPKYALSPSYDNQIPRQEFEYKLGKVTRKFEKYPGDLRYRQYKNTGANTREGMFFLEGKIPNSNMAGGYAMNPENQYEIYLRDQVGRFERNGETGIIDAIYSKESILGNGDFNSGLYQVKYPFYPFNGGYYIESDFIEIRYAEIIYSEAECLLRSGEPEKAGILLNSVRKRNYENFDASIAYEPEGSVQLTMEEMLDEWGREFLAESRRRTDLIRFGRFQEAWWDKPQDPDNHYELFPISQEALEQNSYLRQNPGYPHIAR